MNNNVILIGTRFLDEETGQYGETSYDIALPDGPTDETCEALKMAIAILVCDEWLICYRSLLEELDEESLNITDMLEGRKDHFIFKGMKFSSKHFELDKGKDDAKPVSSLKQGSMLYICCDSKWTPERIISDYHDESNCCFVRFFRKSDPQTLTFLQYMPFVLEGDAGYMILPDGKVCGGPYTFARQLAGMNFLVAEPAPEDQEYNSYIVNVAGEKLTPDYAKIEEGNPGFNGYILFCAGGRWGFIHAESGITSPAEYEDIDPVEMGELVKVKKDGVWGYLTEDFNFISKEEADEDYEKHDLCYWRGDD